MCSEFVQFSAHSPPLEKLFEIILETALHSSITLLKFLALQYCFRTTCKGKDVVIMG